MAKNKKTNIQIYNRTEDTTIREVLIPNNIKSTYKRN